MKIVLLALLLSSILYFTWHLGRLYETNQDNKRWESVLKVPGIIVDWETEFDPETGKIVSITYWLE